MSSNIEAVRLGGVEGGWRFIMYAMIIYYVTSHIIVALQNNGALQTHVLNINDVRYNERWLPCVVM